VILERSAYAKVNLVLSVGPPEATDGASMHPIASWMHAVDLADSVRLEWLGEHHPMRFEVAWAGDAPRPSPIDWPPEKDLGMRAVRLMEQAIGRALPVSIRIQKRIPVGGGLGGGSSDAAAVMTGVRDLLSLRMTDQQLCGLSARLGSDIAFFIGQSPPAPALVRGMGDRIERVGPDWVGKEIVLVLPTFGCATGPVYKEYDRIGARPLRDVVPFSGELFNDLLLAAEAVQPRLAGLRRDVERAAGVQVFMSGSGSTLFLLPETGAGDLAAKIGREVSDISVVKTRLV
jgi:4-diphosphocytidyl-2-C-methyl-D-erythritol kinase